MKKYLPFIVLLLGVAFVFTTLRVPEPPPGSFDLSGFGRLPVLVNGRLVAEGSPPGLRALMDERPRRVQVVTTNARAMAAGLAGLPGVVSVELTDDGVLIETRDATALARTLPELAVATNAQLRSVEPTDENLESVYGYLTERARGARR